MNQNEKVINLCKFVREYLNITRDDIDYGYNTSELVVYEKREILRNEIELLLGELNPQTLAKENPKQLNLF
jgi:hypothetical protein